MAKVINTVLSLKDDFSGVLEKVQKNANNAVGRIRKTVEGADSPTKKLAAGLKGVGAEFQRMGQAVMPMSIAATGALAACTKSAADFEQAMQNTWSIAKAGNEGSAKAFKTLQDAAKAAGEQGYYSATEAADALGYMALAGWDAEKSAAALPDVLNLAAAASMDLAQASDMVTDYMSAFSETAMSTTQFTDMLSYAQNNSNTTVSQLGEAYKNCAANLNAAGQDAYTVTSMLEAMANQGIKGSEAGTKLTAVMRDMTARMQDGAIKIGDTSVAVQDASGNYRDLTDIIRDVDAATQGMGKAEKAAALSSVFTADSISGLNLILNEGIDKVSGYEDALRNSAGSAADAAAERQESLYGVLNRLKNQFGTLAIDIGSQFVPILSSLADKLSSVGKWFNSLGNGTKTFIAVVLAVVAALGPVLVILGTVISAIGSIVGAIGTVVGAIGGVTAVAGGIIPLLAGVAAAAGPFLLGGAIIAGVIAAIVLIVKHWDQIKAVFGNVINFLKARLKDFTDNAKIMWNSFKAAAVKVFTVLKNVATTVMNGIKSVVTVVVNAIKALWTAYWTMQTAKWRLLATVVTTVVNTIRNVVTAGFNAVKSAITGAINSAKSTLQSGFNAMKNSASSVVDGIVSKFNSLKSRLTSIVDSIKSKISSVTSAVSSVGGFLTGHATGTPYFTGGLTRINEHGGEIVNLPSGTQIIPHDLSKKQLSGSGVTVNVTVQGNIIGNAEYADYLGGIITRRVISAMNNI